MPQTDVRILVPRVRRSIEGVGTTEVLSDDDLKDLVADALADITLYTGSVFGKTLEVSGADDEGIPQEYATSEPLTLAEGSVVAAQATLNSFFHRFSELKISEKIGDEAQTWEYARSAQLLRDQFAYLVRTRDDALAEAEGGVVEAYASFLAVRDAAVAAYIEPWVAESGQLVAGQDYRFGTLG